MKSMFAVVLATLFVTFVAATPKCPTRQVEDVILLRNPSDCSTFYVCANGQAHLMTCSEGLHFNSELRVCDWPERANCEEFHPRPSTTSSEPPADLSSESEQESTESAEESSEPAEEPSQPAEESPQPTETSPQPSETSPQPTETSPELEETSPHSAETSEPVSESIAES
ncbi:PREDICTED: cell wall protein 1-like [Eufriesea mexicana]|uniref:cell wall protein 1-like n=1 Tax=Eufriesea mexicana TaxID=516756 RepID=UPI00083BACB4|nr:PREDICTED: cell wall protein 1-like [Eufriesea mexicana]